MSKRRVRKPSAKASDSGASGSAGGNSLRGYYMRERQKQQVGIPPMIASAVREAGFLSELPVISSRARML